VSRSCIDREKIDILAFGEGAQALVETHRKPGV